MRWRKRGFVYGPDGSRPWARSHALAPTPILLGSKLRVYFASCDAEMVGRVGYVDLDPDQPDRVIAVAERPALDSGAPGCFDDNGVNVTSLVETADGLFMYYFGYQLATRVRYLLFGGLAVSRDGGESFERVSQVPILERRDGERLVRSAPCVLAEPEGGFRMWYVSGDVFIDVNGKDLPYYGLRHGGSSDGIVWKTGATLLAPDGDDEHGFGRPYVRRTKAGYEMWYSVRSRSKGYRLGYATSADGLAWTRHDDEVGLDVSRSGWDAAAVCYAAVITLGDRTFMLYNGNEYGRMGFGLAELEGA